MELPATKIAQLEARLEYLKGQKIANQYNDQWHGPNSWGEVERRIEQEVGTIEQMLQQLRGEPEAVR